VQDAIAQLTSLGRLTSQQVQIQDLQQQLDDLDRRLAVLRARIAHLTALLADPGLTPERQATLRAQRDALQRSLAEARRARAETSQQAALATIQLTLATKEGSSGAAPASRLDRTLHEAGRILAWEGIALLYALVVVGPVAVVALLAWLAARLRRRGEERRLLARP
jgi:chromosome segregation ATPase